ncbi:MAG: hypothetical protein QOI61_1731 [Actinomycetota bacterium]|jgi:hypothetical protein
MFPSGAVSRTFALLTGLFAFLGCWTLFWSVVALFTGGELSVARTAVMALVWVFVDRRMVAADTSALAESLTTRANPKAESARLDRQARESGTHARLAAFVGHERSLYGHS